MGANPGELLGTLTQLGWSPAQAAGILGNLQQESSFNPTIWGDNGTSFGLAQWRGDRLSGLQNYASQNNLDYTDPHAQLKYLDWELRNKEKTAFNALQGAQTPQDAAAAFMHFERPAGYTPDNPTGGDGWGNRLKNALSIAGMPATTAAMPRPLGLLAGAMGAGPTDPASPQGEKKDESDPIKGLLAQMMPRPAQQQEQSASGPRMGLLAEGDIPGGHAFQFQQRKVQLGKRKFA